MSLDNLTWWCAVLLKGSIMSVMHLKTCSCARSCAKMTTRKSPTRERTLAALFCFRTRVDKGQGPVRQHICLAYYLCESHVMNIVVQT